MKELAIKKKRIVATIETKTGISIVRCGAVRWANVHKRLANQEREDCCDYRNENWVLDKVRTHRLRVLYARWARALQRCSAPYILPLILAQLVPPAPAPSACCVRPSYSKIVRKSKKRQHPNYQNLWRNENDHRRLAP